MMYVELKSASASSAFPAAGIQLYLAHLTPVISLQIFRIANVVDPANNLWLVLIKCLGEVMAFHALRPVIGSNDKPSA